MIKPDIWENCYIEMWKGFIVDEAFCHPAKFSHALIGKIYAHALKNEWVKKGDYVLDPFAGVALGALHSLVNGLNWIGVELKEKFVNLGQQNIDLWTHKFRDWPHLGTARIIQGDSRNLIETLRGAGLNPRNIQGRGQARPANLPPGPGRIKDVVKEAGLIVSSPHQAFTPGNLVNMREGNIDAVIGSPPYAEQQNTPRCRRYTNRYDALPDNCKGLSRARPMYPDWVRSVRDQCQAAGVLFFFKQWGKTPYPPNSDISPWTDAGFDPYSKNGSRELDGREWNELPETK